MRRNWARWIIVVAASLAYGCGSSAKQQHDVPNDAGISAIHPEDAAGPEVPLAPECRMNDDCDSGKWCTSDGVCAPGCRNNEECQALHGGATAVRCDLSTHVCTGCVGDVDCPAGYICDASAVCVAGCTDAHACADEKSCCGGTCVDLTSDLTHCGACNATCAPAHSTGECGGGVCAITTCATGFDDCDSSAANGCEIDLTSDLAHCGGCGNACAFDHAAASCVAGACVRGACEAGWFDCDLDPESGCEENLKTLDHCGACGVSCYPDDATGSCATGKCVITACATGHADCDGDVANGCEIDVTNDEQNCGACKKVCPDTGGTAFCTAGVCGFTPDPPDPPEPTDAAVP